MILDNYCLEVFLPRFCEVLYLRFVLKVRGFFLLFAFDNTGSRNIEFTPGFIKKLTSYKIISIKGVGQG